MSATIPYGASLAIQNFMEYGPYGPRWPEWWLRRVWTVNAMLEDLRSHEEPMSERVISAIASARAKQVDREMMALAGRPYPADEEPEDDAPAER